LCCIEKRTGEHGAFNGNCHSSFTYIISIFSGYRDYVLCTIVSQKLSDKLATRLIQFAIGLSVLTFIVTQNIVSTLSVIVVAGACGLAVGTPIALLATNGKLSRRGVIVKGGLQIENLSGAGTIVFDKTGTLTSGKPVVSEVVSFDPIIDPIRVLECAAIAEK